MSKNITKKDLIKELGGKTKQSETLVMLKRDGTEAKDLDEFLRDLEGGECE